MKEARRSVATVVVSVFTGISLGVLPATAVAPSPSTASAKSATAGDNTPWTLPSMPAVCDAAAMTSGDVAGCLLDGPSGRPESRGWPTPPFPAPSDAAPVAWTDLAIGATGSRVVVLQKALGAAGFTLATDGQFGRLTEGAVKLFQAAQELPDTGIVDETTAGALGILLTGVGSYPPSGWTWIGWAYNGSAALAGWEALLVGNTSAIGKVGAKQIRSLPEALPLFEGFVRDIVAGGYTITDVGTYAFRCTSTSRKDCDGQSRDQLSNHAYGLALDINTAANPEVTYYGVNGVTACATPLKTDIPTWMVRAGERWGLYWGGYGWNRGCATPGQTRSSVLRDAMHFEFRGTPAQAKAIAAFNASNTAAQPISTPTTTTAPTPTPAAPVVTAPVVTKPVVTKPVVTKPVVLTKTCLDIADDTGVVTQRCLNPGEVPRGGWRTVIDTKAPAGATAAVVNITLSGATLPGYVTAEACGAVSGQRTWSNGNATPGVTSANLSVVALDGAGRFCLYQSQPVQTIVDVQGFFAPSDSLTDGGNLLTAVAPQRLIDTRTETFCTPSGPCDKRGPVAANTEVMLATPLVPANAVAMLANLTVTDSTADGYVTADSCSALVPGPQTRSNTNFNTGATVANLAVVPTTPSASGAQICTYTSATTQKAIDVQGYFAPATAGGWGYAPAPVPQRLVDTRGCWTDPSTATQRCGKLNSAGSIVRIQGPVGQSAVLVNLTLTGAKKPGYATADRCSALQAGPQRKSNGNMSAGVVAANVAVVPLDADGTFCVYLSEATDLVVDLQGSFSPTAPLRFVPLTPIRRHDSREFNS